MQEQALTRREVLKGGFGLTAGLLLPEIAYSHEAEGVTEPIKFLEPPMAIGKAAWLTRMMAEQIEALSPHTAKIRTLREAQDFADEFVTYLHLIEYQTFENLIYPELRTEDFGDEIGAHGDFYLMAYAECGEGDAYYGIEAGDGSIALNGRYFDTQSPMSRDDKNYLLVGTLAHEICHSNQLSCEPTLAFLGDVNMIEGTTNIAAMNALFAMAMDGNSMALTAGLGILKDMAQAYVLVENKDNITAYEKFLANLPNHIEEEAYFNLIKSGDGSLTSYINAMKMYNSRPFVVVSNAMVEPNLKTKPLPVPTNNLSLYHTQYVLSNMSHFIDQYD